jgi:GNAT superfamily N-acetyltransferase
VSLLVDALNRCWSPYFPDEPAVTSASFKWSIRHLQVWCSSCMVAFSGADPIGVLIGGKRPSGTLIYRIAVHPDHRRQGHGRHLLTSLSSKLAILGPPRMIAEVPETFVPTCELFNACGYREEAVLTDYVLEGPVLSEHEVGEAGPMRVEGPALSVVEGFVIPVTVDDLAANGLLGEHDPPSPSASTFAKASADGSARQVQQVCWERSVETLTARKDDIAGLAIASDERIEAYLLYIEDEIVALRTLVEDGGARLKQLLARLDMGTLRFPKVHPAEISKECLETLGFRPAGKHLLYTAKARSE